MTRIKPRKAFDFCLVMVCRKAVFDKVNCVKSKEIFQFCLDVFYVIFISEITEFNFTVMSVTLVVTGNV
jgi:hypothetical protein